MNTAALPMAPLPVTAAGMSFSKSLAELLEDGVYLLFLLRSGNPPKSLTEFNRRVDHFLSQFESNAHNLNKPAAAISEAKYAFCALMDEIVLSSDFAIRDDWERAPLQLRIFGEHLAGERFFDKLESLRLDPVANLEALEVYYTCLILGFQGKYLLEGTEKLNYLVSRIGQEIAHARGGKPEFSPHWKPPHRFQQYVRNELPMWLFFALLALVATILFFAFHWLLQDDNEQLAEMQARPVITQQTVPSAPIGDTPQNAPAKEPATKSI